MMITQENMLKLTIHGQEKQYLPGTSFQDIAKDCQGDFRDDIVLLMFNNRLRELNKKTTADGEITFITTKDKAGRKAYRRSLTLLMQRAAYNIAKREGNDIRVKVCQSISQAYYCQLIRHLPGQTTESSQNHLTIQTLEETKGDVKATEQYLSALKEEMQQLIEGKLPIQKRSIHTDEAVTLFQECGMTDKEKLFRYRRSSRVNIYSIGNYTDYYYGYMVPDTSYLKYFDLRLYADGFVLLFPDKNPQEVAEFIPSPKLFGILRQSREWGEKLGIDTVGALNDAIANGKIENVILVQEALMERRIGKIAETIAEQSEKKFVMIAGPSSSGKTTFSHRLSIQLMAQGLNPHPIALDDYYVNRQDTPLDEAGNYDFECLEALDISLFNQQMTDLLNGKEVDMPSYNFKTGKREYRGKYKRLGKNDILVLEGIHGLNDKLSHSLPRSSKLKIYISALTQLNIDEHNTLPTTDGRLIRRMVRDSWSRNLSAQETFSRWDSVRRGEEKHIFPFQEEADIMFNSALIYEIAVLKQYAEPLLFHIDRHSAEYLEAKRILKFLDYFLPVPSDKIQKNSILREFIGGSCFHI
jgi:uridine kinase